MNANKSPIAKVDTANDATYFLVWRTISKQHGTQAANQSYQQVRWLLREGEVINTALILKLYDDYTKG